MIFLCKYGIIKNKIQIVQTSNLKYYHKRINKEYKTYDIIQQDTLSIRFRKQMFARDSSIQFVPSECTKAILIGSTNNKYLLSYSTLVYEQYYAEIYCNVYQIDDENDYGLKLISENVHDCTTLNALYYSQLLSVHKYVCWVCDGHRNALLYCFEGPSEAIRSRFSDKHKQSGLYVLKPKYFCEKT
eukprot:690176_1